MSRYGLASPLRPRVDRSLPETEANAALHLFSHVPELVKYGRAHYQVRSPDTSTLLYRLLDAYRQEGVFMPYTMADFRRDFRKEFLAGLTAAERKEFLAHLSPAERREFLAHLTAAERREVLQTLGPEERLEGLSTGELLKLREEIERCLKQHKNGTSSEPATDG